MTVTPGSRVGPYEIVALLGEGGMGEVFRARDGRLGRDVAIKVLPTSVAADPERLQRFEVEARAAGQLNHPNVLTVYDVGTHDGAPYLVSELLEGETLRAQLATGALPVRTAIDFAVQMANGLAAAHDRGIIHRDLKPENLFVTRDGRLKILDFGLARVLAPPGTSETQAPTALHATNPGTVLGTAGYMSPEQVRGRPVDHRTDLFSLGAVLYEMLTGHRAFRGDSNIETMNAILKEDPPDVSEPPRGVPTSLSRVVQRCLAKSAEQRFQSARDLAFALDTSHSSSDRVAPVAGGSEPRRVAWRPWSIAAVFAIVAAGLAALHVRPAPPESRLVSFTIPPPPKSTITYGQLSPDGKYLAFRVTEAGGQRRLWIRSLDSLTPQPLPGTEEGDRPFWSPDSRFVAFFSGKQLKKIDVTGGPVQIVADLPAAAANGGAWGSRGEILVAISLSGISHVPAQGGTLQPLTTLDTARKETRHYFPTMLPDGNHFLYVVTSADPETQGLWVSSIDDPRTKRRLVGDLSEGVFSEGHVLFARRGTLMAQPFDPDRLELRGDAVPIVDKVNYSGVVGFADFSVSQNATLEYIGVTTPWRLTWFDRAGKRLGAFGAGGAYQSISLSPDGSRVAVDASSSTDPHYELFVIDPIRDTTTQLTFGEASGNFPTWSPNGSVIAFGSIRDGIYNIYKKPVDSPGQDVVLWKSDRNKFLMDWSRDGKFLVYGETNPKNQKESLWVLPAGGGKPAQYTAEDFDNRHAQFSPDGKWIAYSSDESSTVQVYVQSFPAGSGKWQISTEGGDRPRWRPDGKELYYLAPGGKLMAVDVRPGPRFDPGPPKLLFETWVRGYLSEYDVTGDGQRFVLLAPEEGFVPTPATVVMNWTSLLRK